MIITWFKIKNHVPKFHTHTANIAPASKINARETSRLKRTLTAFGRGRCILPQISFMIYNVYPPKNISSYNINIYIYLFIYLCISL